MSAPLLERSDEETLVGRWSRRLANSKLGVAVLSMGESTVVPVPLETVIVPLMIGYPARAWAIGFAALVGCLVGATIFYFAGAALFEPVVAPALMALGLAEEFRDAVSELGEAGSFLAVFLISVGPLPLQLATLGAGATDMSYPLFMAAIAASRAIRYLGLAVVCNLVGERILRWRIPRWITFSAGFLGILVAWAFASLLL